MSAKHRKLRIPTVLAWTAFHGVGLGTTSCIDQGSARGGSAICTEDASAEAGPDAGDAGPDACGVPGVPEEPA